MQQFVIKANDWYSAGEDGWIKESIRNHYTAVSTETEASKFSSEAEARRLMVNHGWDRMKFYVTQLGPKVVMEV